jgi:hypothetical protein
MSFKATLFIEDQQIKVLKCHYAFSQHIDEKGKPAARPRGGRITVLLEATGDNFLVDWVTSETQVKNGCVVFYKRDSMATLKRVEFSDAYCVEFAEDFDSNGPQPLQIELTLSAKELSFGGSSGHKNAWTK